MWQYVTHHKHSISSHDNEGDEEEEDEIIVTAEVAVKTEMVVTVSC